MNYERLNLKTGQVITEDVFAHLEDGIEGASVLMTPILYADLVALRNEGKLKAGMFYRITDYVTTTSQENTQSAGHAFDVIVMATDSQTLSEEARAIVHEGETYFTEAGANLAAWKVWYCLDNDSERFAWAAPIDGILRGITMTKYGYTGECKRAPDKDYVIGAVKYYAWTMVGGPGGTLWFDKAYPTNEDIAYNNAGVAEDSAEFSTYTKEVDKGYGVIYKLADEWGNTCPFDFKNIKIQGYIHEDGELLDYCYIFGRDIDNSLNGKSRSNVVETMTQSGRCVINSVILGSGENQNVHIGFNANNVNLMGVANNIIIGDQSYDITMTNATDVKIGSRCDGVSIPPYSKNIIVMSDVDRVYIENEETASESNLLENIFIISGGVSGVLFKRNYRYGQFATQVALRGGSTIFFNLGDLAYKVFEDLKNIK